MKQKSIFSAIAVCVAVLTVVLAGVSTASAQKRTRVRTTESISVQKNEVKEAAEAVGIQVKNVSKFVFVLGGVAKGLEEMDKQIKDGRASTEVVAQNQQFKNDVLASVRSLRAGLVKIEVDFRAKPALRKYLPAVQGITEQSANAEDLAYSGQFTAAGRELLAILEKLTDALVEMP